MLYTLCLLLAAASPVEQAQDDAATLFPDDIVHTRYLYLDNVDEKDRDSHMAAVSFILNSISTKKKITLPAFVNKEKTVIKFDLRDYNIDPKNYAKFPLCPYTKKTDKLKAMLKCENPIMRSDWFITKAFAPPMYYKLLGVSDLKGFQKRHGYDPKQQQSEQGAVTLSSKVARNARFIKRSETFTGGAMWEVRDSNKTDYFRDVLTDKYDSVQVIAFNTNGLLSYYSADSKGKGMEHLPADIAFDSTKSFEPDLMVYVARNCVACHTTGILPVDDSIRKLLKKDIKLMAPTKELANRLADLFETDIDKAIARDQDIYKEAVMKTTGMESEKFTKLFIAIYKVYNAEVTFEQAAKELGREPEAFKKECMDSGDAALVHLAVIGKIRRDQFEDAANRR